VIDKWLQRLAELIAAKLVEQLPVLAEIIARAVVTAVLDRLMPTGTKVDPNQIGNEIRRIIDSLPKLPGR
jgi:hypothetical protein